MCSKIRAVQLLLCLAAATPAVAEQNYGPGDTLPSAAEKPHQCNNWWPIGPSSPSTRGNTILSFKISPGGTVHDVSLLHSSGDQFLDDAAKACVLTWQYKPAMHKDGTPYEVPWIARISWQHDAQMLPLLATRNVTNNIGMTTGMPRH